MAAENEKPKRRPGLKRNSSEETKAVFRQNLAKARIAAEQSEAVAVARSKNAKKAIAMKSARALLKKLPLGARTGDIIKTGTARNFKIIDEKPIQLESGQWEQKFEQFGKLKIYGTTREFKGLVRLRWDYEPLLENVFDSPILEEIDESEK